MMLDFGTVLLLSSQSPNLPGGTEGLSLRGHGAMEHHFIRHRFTQLHCISEQSPI